MNWKVVKDFNNKGKKQQVERMFNSIAGKYDFLDHLMSFYMDVVWRNKAVKLLKKSYPKLILDIATGTADLAIEEARKLKPEKIIGVDISDKMLEVGQKKIESRKLTDIIQLEQGDSENLRFEDNKFDAASVAFGVRNFENLEKGLSEIYRVLKKEGLFVVLEFSIPENILIKQLYLLYFNRIVPFLGGMVAKNKIAYKYLPGSVDSFPYGAAFENILKKAGFRNVNSKKLSLGICTVYSGIK